MSVSERGLRSRKWPSSPAWQWTQLKVRAVVGLRAEDVCQVYTVPGPGTRHTVLPDTQDKFIVCYTVITHFIYADREAGQKAAVKLSRQ